MDLNDWGSLLSLGILLYSMHLANKIAALKHQIEVFEAERVYFTKLRDEKLASMAADLWETKDLLKDLVAFHKGDGRYSYDPADPR